MSALPTSLPPLLTSVCTCSIIHLEVRCRAHQEELDRLGKQASVCLQQGHVSKVRCSNSLLAPGLVLADSCPASCTDSRLTV